MVGHEVIVSKAVGGLVPSVLLLGLGQESKIIWALAMREQLTRGPELGVLQAWRLRGQVTASEEHEQACHQDESQHPAGATGPHSTRLSGAVCGQGVSRQRSPVNRDQSAILQSQACQRSFRQLEHTGGAAHVWRDLSRRQSGYGADDAVVLIEKHHVDGVAHAEHVDLLAGLDPQPVAGLEAAGAEQALEACPVRVRGAQPFGHRGTGCRFSRLIHRASSLSDLEICSDPTGSGA